MKTKQIETLIAIFQHGTVSAAAEELGTTQPALSKTLKRFEDELGFALFRRIKGRLVATPEGQRLYEAARHLQDHLDSLGQLAHDIRHKRSGVLQIAAAPALCRAIVPRALTAFRARHPGVRIRFEVEHPPAIVTAVRQGRYELGLVHYTRDEPLGGAQPLWTGRMVCIMPPGHPLARLAEVSAGDLKGHALVTYRRSLPFSRLVHPVLERAGIHEQSVLEINYTSAACDLVRLGAGVAVVDEFSIRDDDRDLVVRPFAPVLEVRAGVVTSRGRPLSRLAEDMLQILRASFTPWDGIGPAGGRASPRPGRVVA